MSLERVRTKTRLLVHHVRRARRKLPFNLLFFECLDQQVNALLEFGLVARHEQMVEPYSCVSSDSVLDLRPVAVALLVGHAEKHDVRFL